MLRSFLSFSVLAVLAGCSSSSTTTTTSSSSGGTDTDGGTDAAISAVALPFKPSNISFPGIDMASLGDFVVDRAECSFSTESKQTGCGDMSKLGFALIDQPGAGKIAVYVARNIRVEPNASIKGTGTSALAVVALQDFEVLGGVDVSARQDYASPGGFVHPSKEETKGGGPGGGDGGSSKAGAGGGSFCGIGGKGGALTGGTAGAGGAKYGNAELIPLIGGSAGGSAALNGSGTGGGAVQLVAGKTFTLGISGYVTAGGGGGTFVGAAGSQHGAGGGSGGAILIEAPVTKLLGTLAANGGAGGAKEYGKDGKPDGTAAVCDSPLTNGSVGGSGSANANDNGDNATWVDGDNAPGGGGGAGRIRVNNDAEKNIPLTGTLSPSANGPCASGGPLAH